MKKSLIALAVLAATGAASAQSSVTLYGIVDVWVGSQETGLNADSVTKVGSGGFSSSRVGFQGSEDLGGGLNAIFKLEGNFAADTGVGSSTGGGFNFNRQAYLGLSGGFGTVTIGKVWTAMDDVLFNNDYAFDSAFFAGNILQVNANYEGNPGNTIKYANSFGAFSGAVSYSLDEDNAVKEDIVDFSIGYGAGPITANFAYQLQNGATDEKLTAFNGSYDFGVVKLLGGLGQYKVGASKSTDYHLGLDVPLSSAMTLSGGYSASTDNAAAGDNERSGFGIALNYALSKRTNAYVGYTQDKTENAAGAKTDENSLMAVGIRHTF
ncbi:porin [Hydrogenophaga sp.]|uniref:porin n=1 Tax=Hydrogenophaga sp. TaxID=1904254 RepID=UPI0025C38621|nr:porin [Hydrogenophaga sp.]